ncbi:S-layer homology domain-containing protein [Paenibacillus beijingensis]|uniref:S-layer homology domain-containing protein n=1 Tax=Paenibacillus beijingensis TaxID=1126833 RepID=UPI00069688BE|nr:S-layer homology domain-containing protein [Paenibacillus beijingensis]
MKLKIWKRWVLMCTVSCLLFSLLVPGLKVANADAPQIDYTKVPELLITELVPDSSNVPNFSPATDAFEFIEVYNNSSQPVNLKDYQLVYHYGTTDNVWTAVSGGEVFVAPQQSIVLWVMNSNNTSQTAEAFNANYGTSLQENVDLFRVSGGGGMANGSARDLIFKDSSGNIVVSASYQTDEQTQKDKGIFYSYSVDGSTAMSMITTGAMAAGLSAATPGTLDASQIPLHPSDYIAPPQQSDLQIGHTPAAEAPDNQDVAIAATVTGSTYTVTASVYYKTDIQMDYAFTAMNPADGSTFIGSIPHLALAAGNSLQYYIQALDGSYSTVNTNIYTVPIRKTAVEPAELSLLITELVPDSSNVPNYSPATDGYEFIEVYNNTNDPVNFKDFSLYYRNGSTDTLWPVQYTGDVTIPAHEPIVLWVINNANLGATEQDFNNNFNTSLVENTNLFRVSGGGMANGGPRDLLIKSSSGKEIVKASYQNDSQTEPNKGIFYQYPAGTGHDMTMMDNPGTIPATPGSVDEAQVVPKVPNPTLVINHTPVPQASKNADLTLTAAITDPEMAADDTVTASVYYKTSSQQFFSFVPMTTDGNSYQGVVPKSAFREPGLQYYIAAKDKNNNVKTDLYNVALDVTPDETKAPPMLITELVPDSNNVITSDDGEFIEVYNNTDQTIQFKDYKIYYRYPDSGTAADVIWASDREDLQIEAGKTMVFWVINSGNSGQSVADFNAAYNTNLVENKDIVKVYADGMANGSKRGVAVGTNTHEDIVSAYYDGSVQSVSLDGKVIKEVAAGKGIYYKYPSDGIATMLKYSVGTKNATPGTVEAEQLPSQPIHLPEDSVEPTIADHTGKTEVSQSDKLELLADVKDDKRILSVSAYYKSDLNTVYTKRNLTPDFNDTMYHQLLTIPDLLGKKYIDYYFEASDGTHTVTSPVTRVSIKEGGSRAPLRLNVKDGDVLSGTSVLKGTAENAGPDTLQLKIDGMLIDDTYHALENEAYFAFEANDVNYYFKNAVTMGQEILYTFMDPITTYTTLSYPIEADRLKEGSNLIAIRAGTKTGPFDERPEENKDDFKVRNVRLVLTDGTVIYDPLYAEQLKVLKIGDSGDTNRYFEFNFNIPADRLHSKAYNWSTNEAADGEHTVELTAADNSKVTAKVIVDNTAPTVNATVTEGETYRGEFTIDAAITDALAGVASTTVTLDGAEITLPYATSSGALAGGEHTLVITAKDKVGNTAEKTIKFNVPNENPDSPELVSPWNGAAVTDSSVNLSVKVKDPTNDALDVSFFKGFKYDANSKTGFTGFQGQSDIEPPKQIQTDGETEMNASDYQQISAADGQYLKNDSTTKFPYHRFDIKLDSSVKETDIVDITWQGKSLNERQVSLYAWQPASGQWQMLDTIVAGVSDFTLKAMVNAGDFNSNGTIHVMVQDQIASNQGDPPAKEDPYEYTFVWMSDTQYYSASYPWIYEGNTQWIADHQQELNIKYVIHTGDIVDNAEEEYQWDNANKAMKTLEDAKIPYGVLAGNHDVSHQTGDYTNYYKHYGDHRFKDQPTFGGSYKNNRGHYDLISAGGTDFIIVYMGWGINNEDIDWMQKVVSEHPDRKAILCFHEYMLVSNNRAPIAEKVFERVVKPNKNVIAALSGHYHDAETLIDKIDDDGDGVPDREVYQMLADYQGAPEGGLGYIRLMQFDPQTNKIHMKSYSPYLNDYNFYDPKEFPDKDEYDMNVDLNPMLKRVETDYFGARVYTDQFIGQAENVPSGQQASAMWSGLESNKYYEWFALAHDDYSGITLSDIWGFATGEINPGNPNPGNPGPENPNPGNPSPGNPNPGNPNPGNPNPENPNPGNPNPGNPNPENPNPENPNPGNPSPGNPSPGNPSPSNPSSSASGDSSGTVRTGNALTVTSRTDGTFALGGADLKAAVAQAVSGQVEIKLNAAAGGGANATLQLNGEGISQAQQSGVTLKIVTPQATIEMPAGALPNGLSSSDSIVLSIDTRPNGTGQNEISGLIANDSGYRSTGRIYNLNLTLIQGNKETAIHTLAKPVTIRQTLSADQLSGIDKEYAGVYYLNNGKLEYVGGSFEGNELVFTTGHFSTFTLLEYRKNFADMKGNWANSYVQKLAAKHIVTGLDDTRYAPNQAVTRADFAILAVRALGYDKPQGASNFKDVPAGAYFAGYVAKAAELGLIKGEGGSYRPQSNITREEAMVILIRAYEAKTGAKAPHTTGSVPFADMKDASSWALQAIGAGQSLGLVSGKEGNRFDPKDQVTRAEIAKMIYGLLNTKA